MRGGYGFLETGSPFRVVAGHEGDPPHLIRRAGNARRIAGQAGEFQGLPEALQGLLRVFLFQRDAGLNPDRLPDLAATLGPPIGEAGQIVQPFFALGEFEQIDPGPVALGAVGDRGGLRVEPRFFRLRLCRSAGTAGPCERGEPDYQNDRGTRPGPATADPAPALPFR